MGFIPVLPPLFDRLDQSPGPRKQCIPFAGPSSIGFVWSFVLSHEDNSAIAARVQEGIHDFGLVRRGVTCGEAVDACFIKSSKPPGRGIHAAVECTSYLQAAAALKSGGCVPQYSRGWP